MNMSESNTAEAHADAQIVAFLRGLRRDTGAFADAHDGEGALRPTLSVLKVLEQLGALGDELHTRAFIQRCRTESGGFGATPGAAPTPLDTTAALICLKTLGRRDELDEVLPAALAYLASAASTKFDHFMRIAAYEECRIAAPMPADSIAFFERMLAAAAVENKVVDLAIAGSALMRAGVALSDVDDVLRRLRVGQNTAEGGHGDGAHATLFGTYCVMRQLALLDAPPNTRRMRAYVASLRTDLGYADAPGGKTTAGATYQCLGILAWLRDLQGGAVNAARAGDVAVLRAWLADGGEPNEIDAQGWTPLLAAAAHGRADAVELLLHPDAPDAQPADPAVRFVAADALPLYMAAHSGDLRTVQSLLRAAPEHLHAISAVNGHTALLQAAFYGKQKHLALAEWILEAHPQDRQRLLSATNVRGYNALSMQDLWHNEAMRALLLRFYPGGVDGEFGRAVDAATRAYHADLLLRLASPQMLTEKLMAEITAVLNGDDAAVQRIDALLALPQFEIDRLGGELQMPPLVFALTGVDVGQPERARRRRMLVEKLLVAGANPAVREKHPMAVGAVIRASVLNNFELLQLLAEHMSAADFAVEMNVRPAVNGLTAMHDAVHRALTAPPAQLAVHLAQIEWMIARGARLDIMDNTGQTQRQLAAAALGDAAFPQDNVRAVLDVLARASNDREF
jgi:hypothetical protein